MLTLYQKGQIQREFEGEVKHTELFVLQYPHLLVPVMNALQSLYSYALQGSLFKNEKQIGIINTRLEVLTYFEVLKRAMCKAKTNSFRRPCILAKS